MGTFGMELVSVTVCVMRRVWIRSKEPPKLLERGKHRIL